EASPGKNWDLALDLKDFLSPASAPIKVRFLVKLRSLWKPQSHKYDYLREIDKQIDDLIALSAEPRSTYRVARRELLRMTEEGDSAAIDFIEEKMLSPKHSFLHELTHGSRFMASL